MEANILCYPCLIHVVSNMSNVQNITLKQTYKRTRFNLIYFDYMQVDVQNIFSLRLLCVILLVLVTQWVILHRTKFILLKYVVVIQVHDVVP